jgi:predicted enzyme related to lactoylglutathione lyase
LSAEEMSDNTPVNNIVHFQFGVTDLLRAKQFYSKVFSWKFHSSDTMPDYLYFDIGGDITMSGGIQLVDGPVTTGNVRVYIQVKDINYTLERIVEYNGKVILEKTKLSDEGGYIARFEDPFGNIMGIWSGS